MTDNFDTSDVLTEEDYKTLENILRLKKKIFQCIDMDNFIKKATEIIDNSPLVSFKNERVKKFIDKKRPNFIIVVDKDKAMKEKGVKSFSDEEIECKFYSSIIYDEVISKITEIIKGALDDIGKDEKDKIFKDITLFKKEDENNKELINNFKQLAVISSLYGMRLDKENKNNVVVEMLI